MLLKCKDYRFVASDISVFYYNGEDLIVHNMNGMKYSIHGPKTIFGQFEEQYIKYLSTRIMRGK
jgi:hypothetical protein